MIKLGWSRKLKVFLNTRDFSFLSLSFLTLRDSLSASLFIAVSRYSLVIVIALEIKWLHIS